MFTKDLEELENKQTEIYNTLRITEANKRIDLEDKMLEITAPKQNTEKKNEKK